MMRGGRYPLPALRQAADCVVLEDRIATVRALDAQNFAVTSVTEDHFTGFLNQRGRVRVPRHFQCSEISILVKASPLDPGPTRRNRRPSVRARDKIADFVEGPLKIHAPPKDLLGVAMLPIPSEPRGGAAGVDRNAQHPLGVVVEPMDVPRAALGRHQVPSDVIGSLLNETQGVHNPGDGAFPGPAAVLRLGRVGVMHDVARGQFDPDRIILFEDPAYRGAIGAYPG